MNAVQIIDEIRHLPPGEQARVVHFVRTLDEGQRWTGQELGEAAGRLAEESDPAKAQALKERIATGFYGKGQGA
jgi:hypothetical protein